MLNFLLRNQIQDSPPLAGGPYDRVAILVGAIRHEKGSFVGYGLWNILVTGPASVHRPATYEHDGRVIGIARGRN